ncbi:MAG: hypothetical protein ACRETL_04650, partial [Gammaproteobacteria bacterium]
EGTNRLIAEGATMVRGAEDILTVLGPITGRFPVRVVYAAGKAAATDAGRGVPGASSMARPDADLAATRQSAAAPEPGYHRDQDGEEVRDRVLSALGPHPVDIDALVRAVGLSPRSVQIALVELDLAGRIERHGAQLVSLKLGSG